MGRAEFFTEDNNLHTEKSLMEIYKKKEFGEIRTIEFKGKPYFVGNDIAKALEYARPYEAVSAHCKGAVSYRILTNGGIQENKIIPEGDVYRLILKASDQSKNSNIKAKAKRFEAWVFDEVLPSIRKNGMYAEDDLLDNPDLLLKVVMKLKTEREAKRLAEQRAQELEAELDQNKDWYSIKRVAALNGVEWRTFDWRKLKSTGLDMGYEVKKIFDANYGEVNTYHREVWEAVYPEYEI